MHLETLTPLLASELNAKRVTFAASSDSLVSLTAKPNFRTLGKRYGKRTPAVAMQPAQDPAGWDECVPGPDSRPAMRTSWNGT